MVNDPKDENDPTRLRRFAKRIADMKWWDENSSSAEPAEIKDQEAASEETQLKSEDQQQPPAGHPPQ
jgi:hypothetical protein